VYIKAWGETYPGTSADRRFAEGSLEKIAETYRSDSKRLGNHAIEVAVRDGQVMGFGEAAPTEHQTFQRSDAEILAIYLLRSIQRQGIGRELVRRLAESMRQAGARSMCVWVAFDNPNASRFYEALGGKLVDQLPYNSGSMVVPLRAYRWKDIQTLIG
jgi:ribosomal protein S18 acetylase RimI-like enzyme